MASHIRIINLSQNHWKGRIAEIVFVKKTRCQSVSQTAKEGFQTVIASGAQLTLIQSKLS